MLIAFLIVWSSLSPLIWGLIGIICGLVNSWHDGSSCLLVSLTLTLGWERRIFSDEGRSSRETKSSGAQYSYVHPRWKCNYEFRNKWIRMSYFQLFKFYFFTAQSSLGNKDSTGTEIKKIAHVNQAEPNRTLRGVFFLNNLWLCEYSLLQCCLLLL